MQSGHGHRYLVYLYRRGFLGLQYTQVKTGLKGLAISDLQGSVVIIRALVIHLEAPYPQAIFKFHRLSGLENRLLPRTPYSLLVKLPGIIFDCELALQSLEVLLRILFLSTKDLRLVLFQTYPTIFTQYHLQR